MMSASSWRFIASTHAWHGSFVHPRGPPPYTRTLIPSMTDDPRSLETKRLSVLPKYLTVAENEAILRRRFISPMPGQPAMSEVRRRAVVYHHDHRSFASHRVPVPFSTLLCPLPFIFDKRL